MNHSCDISLVGDDACSNIIENERDKLAALVGDDAFSNIIENERDQLAAAYNLCSPVTGLSLDLEDLSTSSGCGPTPKRRLSLSSFDFTPVAAPSHGFQARRASVVENNPITVFPKSSLEFRVFSHSSGGGSGSGSSCTSGNSMPPMSDGYGRDAPAYLPTPRSNSLQRVVNRSLERFHSFPKPNRTHSFGEDSEDSGLGIDQDHIRFSVGDDELNEESQESGISIDNDASSSQGDFSQPSSFIDHDLEVQSLNSGSISSTRLFVKRSVSFDIRSRPFGYKRVESSDPVEDAEQPKRRVKRLKSLVESPVTASQTKLLFSRSVSEIQIERALERCDEQENLIGDFSRPYLLPLVIGRHSDLRSISPQTLASVVCDKTFSLLNKLYIIDCRYPYEYVSGHIKHALNMYTRETVKEEMLMLEKFKSDKGPFGKRTVLVFHCEFSSERGPALSRYLREEDRKLNKECYPKLCYPEVYLLEGGYKAFYEQYKELCEPQGYKPMSHEDHVNDLRHFRTKSKSWACERGNRAPFRQGLNF